MKILAVETSCDETSVSVLECKGGLKNPKFSILSNIVFSQVELHAPFGGVVPNLAKREHQRNLVPSLIQALEEAGLIYLKSKISNLKSQTPRVSLRGEKSRVARDEATKQSHKNGDLDLLNNYKKLQKILEREPELSEQLINFLNKYEIPKIDLIAVTQGPGLEPALWMGVNFARAMSTAFVVPLLGVNHLEGHIFSVFLKNRENLKSKISNLERTPKTRFPALALIVSGGHTELVLVNDWLKYKIIGSTLDDAAGEAFDKAARILGLGYPGGPLISREAEKLKLYTLNSSGYNLSLPRPMINSKDFNFSFSGLKTAVLYLTQDLKKSGKWSDELIPQTAHEFQNAVVDVLVSKSLKAAENHSVKSFILCGGVSANKELRERLAKDVKEKFSGKVNFFMPDLEFSGDNAAMIAAAAYPNYLNLKTKGKSPKISPIIKANGNLNF